MKKELILAGSLILFSCVLKVYSIVALCSMHTRLQTAMCTQQAK